MTDDDRKIEELAKSIYSNIIGITFSQDMAKMKQRVLAATAFEAAKIFYEYANDRKCPK